jgi:hypothetical protein
VKQIGKPAEFLGKVFLEGGRVDLATLMELYGETYQQIGEKLDLYGFGEAVGRGAAEAAVGGSYALMEKLCDNLKVRYAKGAQFITMQIGNDAYAFSRQAHRSLGSAPILYNDTTTYIPINFITEILGGVYNLNEDNTYEIINPAMVTVTEVLEDGSLLVNDGYLGEVLVRIAETTTLTDGTNAVEASVIEAGMTLAVGYDVAMTMSIPPQTTARFIRVENLPVEEVEAETVAFTGIITEIDGELVTLGNPAEDTNAIRLVISSETVITDANGNAVSFSDLKVGMEVKGAHSAAATFSIPPQSVAVQVEIVK